MGRSGPHNAGLHLQLLVEHFPSTLWTSILKSNGVNATRIQENFGQSMKWPPSVAHTCMITINSAHKSIMGLFGTFDCPYFFPGSVRPLENEENTDVWIS